METIAFGVVTELGVDCFPVTAHTQVLFYLL